MAVSVYVYVRAKRRCILLGLVFVCMFGVDKGGPKLYMLVFGDGHFVLFRMNVMTYSVLDHS